MDARGKAKIEQIFFGCEGITPTLMKQALAGKVSGQKSSEAINMVYRNADLVGIFMVKNRWPAWPCLLLSVIKRQLIGRIKIYLKKSEWTKSDETESEML
jgi:hypothetical protein